MTDTTAAARLAEAMRSQSFTPMPEGLDLAAAYAVQDQVVEDLIRSGWVPTGAKIGVSSPQAQAALGVDTPLSGILFQGMHLCSGQTIPAGGVRQPRMEAEICFRLKSDLSGPRISEAEAMAAIAEIMPAIEVVDSRYEGWPGGAIEILAEDISAAWFVTGDVAEVDVSTLAERTMTMSVNGAEVSSGQASATNGGPVQALTWLAQNLADRGRPLRAGDYVMSGAFAAMTPVALGDTVRVDIPGVGSVEVTVPG